MSYPTLNRSKKRSDRPAEGVQVRILEEETELIVSVDEAKTHAKIDYDGDDTLIEQLIRTVTSKAEDFTQRAILRKTIRIEWERFNDYAVMPLPPHVLVESVEQYEAGSDTWEDVDTYTVRGEEIKTLRVTSVSNSFTTTGYIDVSIRATVLVGYDPADYSASVSEDSPANPLPQKVKDAILDSVTFLYQNRGEIGVDGQGKIDCALTPVSKSLLSSLRIL